MEYGGMTREELIAEIEALRARLSAREGVEESLRQAAVALEEMRKSQEALEEERNKFRTLLESIPAEVWFCDEHGKVSLMNSAAVKGLGIELDTIELGNGASCGSSTPRAYNLDGTPRRAEDGPLRRSLKGETITGLEEVIRGHETGEIRYREINSTPLRTKNGKITGAVAIVHDITGRKLAEEELRRMRDALERRVEEKTDERERMYEKLVEETREKERMEEQLLHAQKMEAIGTLAGGIAHDFNNILAIIIGNAELALDDVEAAGGSGQQSIQQILQASFRARELIKQILTFSRRTEKEKKPLILTPLIKETYKMLRASLPATIHMDLDIKTEDDRILADATQIQQILINLATNAAYAMREEGGRLTVELSAAVFPAGTRRPHRDMNAGSYIQLMVKDTGAGMTTDVRKRIFEPYFTTREGGHGMGLSLVYGMVESHGGAITVQSTPGKGTTFRIFFPHFEPGEAERTAGLPSGTERVLFVDDEVALADIMRGLLERLGYRVTVVTRATEALAMFLEDTSRFDIVITDQTMPDMTGLTLTKKILQARNDVPVILCTGYSETVSPEQAFEAGVCEYVVKPIAKKELAETIRKVLDTPRDRTAAGRHSVTG